MNELQILREPNILQDLSVAVFGGGGLWGGLITEACSKQAKNVQVIEREATPEDAILAAQQNDVIFLAVPDIEINGILIEIRSFLGKSKVLLDCATNKSGFGDTLEQIAYEGTSICSTHPMVMPKKTATRGQTVIVMPLGENAQRATQIAKEVFGMMGMHPEQLDFHLHAETMVILQMVPHLVQRILIDAMGQGLSEKAMTIEDVSRLAPANYLLAELGVGRVGMQKPEVSAGIVATALQTRFGKKILGGMQRMLGQIIAAGEDREELANLFAEGVKLLDPNAKWRGQMTERTEAALIRLGNLRSCSCQIDAPNKQGVLRDILNIFVRHEIDMTALDSQVIYKDDGSSTARFDIGIADGTICLDGLIANLQKIGVELKLSHNPA